MSSINKKSTRVVAAFFKKNTSIIEVSNLPVPGADDGISAEDDALGPEKGETLARKSPWPSYWSRIGFLMPIDAAWRQFFQKLIVLMVTPNICSLFKFLDSI